MSGYPSPTHVKYAVGEKPFIGLLWGGVALSVWFVAFRGYVRLNVFRRFYADDILVLASWLMLLANAIIWQITAGSLYTTLAVGNGDIPPPPNLSEQLNLSRYSQIANFMLNTCGIWAVKFSFMLFFRKIGRNVRGQKWLWWCVLAANIPALVICVGVNDWPCMTSPISNITDNCEIPTALAFEDVTLQIITGCDVITDILILTIPISLLWKVQINNRLKIALIMLFSLTLCIIIVAITRVVVAIGSGDGVDATWLYTLGAIEQATAIIIACLVSYRALFTKESSSQNRGIEGSSQHRPRYEHNNNIKDNSAIDDAALEEGKSSFSTLATESVPLDTIANQLLHEVQPLPEGLRQEQG